MKMLHKGNTLVLTLLQPISSANNSKSSYYKKAWKLKNFILLIHQHYTTENFFPRKTCFEKESMHMGMSSQILPAIKCCENAESRNHKAATIGTAKWTLILKKGAQTKAPFAIIAREEEDV